MDESIKGSIVHSEFETAIEVEFVVLGKEPVPYGSGVLRSAQGFWGVFQIAEARVGGVIIPIGPEDKAIFCDRGIPVSISQWLILGF
jgi:hypothetical protein